MTDKLCTYRDREQTLIAYIYDDIDGATRAEFENHVASCERCRDDIDAFQGVRATLSHWYPPEPRVRSFQPRPAAGSERRRWWRDIPAWAQVAAALLVLGVSAGIANLEVRHDGNGFVVRTGWSKPAAVQPAAANTGATAATASRAEVAELEQRLRAEIRALETAATSAAARSGSSDGELLRKVRALVEESERREQRELALRIAQVITDVNAQRLDDLRKIDVSLRGVQHNLGVEVLKQQQSLNYLATRVSQRQ